MSKTRQCAEDGVLVRFWALDHHRGESVVGPPTPWAMLVYSGEGALFVEADDLQWVLPANRAFLFPGGHRFTMKTLAATRVRSLYFSPDFPLRVEPGPVDVTPLLRELILAACERGPLVADRPESAALAMMVRLEVEGASRLPTSLPWPRTPWLRRFATAAMESTSSLERLLESTGFSRRTVERAILAETHLSLGRWFRQARMLRSLVCLSEGGAVGEAAMEAGYSEPSAYIHAFRRAFGSTPGRIGTLQR